MLRRISTPGKRAVLGTTATNVAILIAGLLGGAITARGLGPDGRGQLAIYVIWGTLLQGALGLGVPFALAFFSASEPASRPRLWRYYRHRLMLPISALVAAGVLFLYVVFLFLGRASTREALIFVAWSPLTQISVAAASFLQGMGKFWRFNVVRFVGGVGPAVGITILTIADSLSVATVGMAYGGAAFLATGVGLYWLAPETAEHDTPGSPGFWKYSFQSVMSMATGTVNARADQYALSLLVGRADLGIYTVASSSTVLLLPLVSGVSMVTFARIAGSKSMVERRLIVRRSLAAVVVGSFLASVALALAAPTLIRVVFGMEYSSGVGPAQVLALSGVFVCANYLLGDILRGMGQPARVVAGEGIGAVVTIVGVAFAARHSLTWVALASAVGYSLTAVYMGLALRGRLRGEE